MARVPNVASERQRRDTVTDTTNNLWDARREKAAVLATYLAQQFKNTSTLKVDETVKLMLEAYMAADQQWEAYYAARKEAR